MRLPPILRQALNSCCKDDGQVAPGQPPIQLVALPPRTNLPAGAPSGGSRQRRAVVPQLPGQTASAVMPGGEGSQSQATAAAASSTNDHQIESVVAESSITDKGKGAEVTSGPGHATPGSFPFLQLPSELRNAIYASLSAPSAAFMGSGNRQLHHEVGVGHIPQVLALQRDLGITLDQLRTLDGILDPDLTRSGFQINDLEHATMLLQLASFPEGAPLLARIQNLCRCGLDSAQIMRLVNPTQALANLRDIERRLHVVHYRLDDVKLRIDAISDLTPKAQIQETISVMRALVHGDDDTAVPVPSAMARDLVGIVGRIARNSSELDGSDAVSMRVLLADVVQNNPQTPSAILDEYRDLDQQVLQSHIDAWRPDTWPGSPASRRQ